MPEEITRAIEVKDGKAIMITTSTKVDISEMEVDIDKLESIMASYDEVIRNSERRKTEILVQLNEEIAKLDKDIARFTDERADIEKQLVAYKLVEKDLPKEEGIVVGE